MAMAMAILTCSLNPCSSAAGPPPLPPCRCLNTACNASRSRARCRSGSSESSEGSLVSCAAAAALESPAAVFVSSAEDVVGPVVVVVVVAETRARAAAGSLWVRSRQSFLGKIRGRFGEGAYADAEGGQVGEDFGDLHGSR